MTISTDLTVSPSTSTNTTTLTSLQRGKLKRVVPSLTDMPQTSSSSHEMQATIGCNCPGFTSLKTKIVNFFNTIFPTTQIEKASELTFEESLHIGEYYQDFLVTNKVKIPEIHSCLFELTHVPSGAAIVHIQNSSIENFFQLSFQTTPPTSNGVAHVLEHMVFCGSRDFQLINADFAKEVETRGIGTFNNACTMFDSTAFMSASINQTDFYNLLRIYIDAVLHPTLSKEAFLKEAVRVEFSEETNRTDISYNGVVFNEMKGAYASLGRHEVLAIGKSLFTSGPYCVCSGGNPCEIIHLTHEEVKEFHKDNYSLGQCHFFFWGNFSLKDHLDTIEKYASSHANSYKKAQSIPLQTRFDTPVKHAFTYPLTECGQTTENDVVLFSWLTCSLTSHNEVLVMRALALVLAATSESILKKKLLDAKLCKDVQCRVDDTFNEVPFTIHCYNSKSDCDTEFLNTILDCFIDIANEGLSSELIESIILQLELCNRSFATNRVFDNSLYFKKLISIKQLGGKLEDALMINSPIANLKTCLNDKDYLREFVYRHFLKNNHRATIILKPEVAIDSNKWESSALEQIKSDTKKNQQHRNEFEEFINYQQLPSNSSCLPKLHLKDISKDVRDYKLFSKSFGRLELHHYPCFTNQIIFVQISIDIPPLPKEDMFNLQIFSLLLSEAARGELSYKEHVDRLLKHVNGTQSGIDWGFQSNESGSFIKPALKVSSSAIYYKADKLFEILKEIFVSVNFSDIERIKKILSNYLDQFFVQLEESALNYAATIAEGHIGSLGAFNNEMNGLNHISNVQSLMQELESSPEAFIKKMHQLHNHCLYGNKVDLVITCDEHTIKELERLNFYGLSDKVNESEAKEYKNWSLTDWFNQDLFSKKLRQAYVMNTSIAHIAVAFSTISETHPDFVALSIATELMKSVLYAKIREHGGAYNTNAEITDWSSFTLTSYRDPNIESTLAAFQESIDYLIEGEFSNEDLENNKMKFLKLLATPLPPFNIATMYFNFLKKGYTLKYRQEVRDKLLTLSRKDIQRVAKRHLYNKLDDKASIVIFTGQELIDKENASLKMKGKPTFEIVEI